MKFFRKALEIIGALSLLVFLIGVMWLVHNVTSENSERVNAAKPEDVRFVLNWGGISTNQDFYVIASYRSPRSFTGDHLDYDCIQLSKFELADQEKNEWHDGPEQNPLFVEALQLAVNDARQHGDCVPPVEEMNSGATKLMFWSVVLHGHEPSAADILLYDPRRRKLYYLSYKT